MRPGPQGQPAEVLVRIDVIEVMSVDDVQGSFTADVIIHLRRSDPRLATDVDEVRTLDLVDVWHPRIQIAGAEASRVARIERGRNRTAGGHIRIQFNPQTPPTWQ